MAYGCTEPFFLIRETYQRRTASSATTSSAGPAYWQVDMNFAKTTPITNRVRLQVRIEAFNIFNSPMYDERQYNAEHRLGGLRPHQPQHRRGQTNFQRFVQLGFRLMF